MRFEKLKVLIGQKINYSVFQKVRHHEISVIKKENCKAIVQIKSHGIRILVLNETLAEVLSFDDIQFTKDLNFSEQISQFQFFMPESGLSELKIEKIWFCYSAEFFCLIPEPLFSEEKAENALLQICDVIYPYSLKSEKLKNDAHLVFALPKAWEDWTTQLFSSSEITWICNQSGLIEDGIKLSILMTGSICMAQIENDHLFIGAFSNGKLLFFNRFKYKSENDLLYFCLLVMEETGLSPESSKFFLAGSLLPGSIGMEKLSRYFGALEFIRPLHAVEIEIEFEMIRHHNYFDLISQVAYIRSL